MTPEYILRRSLCREAYCSDGPNQRQYAASEIENLGYAAGYAEPGYTDPKSGILFANWNHFPAKATELLEKAGWEIEWSDEWSTCDRCGKAVRTSPDSYSWQPYYVLDDDGFTCLDCLDWPTYLESIEDRPNVAVPSGCNPAEFGYHLLEDGFESGFHPGQDDKPADILARLMTTGHQGIVFRISGKGQFDIGFQAWERDKEVA